MRGLCAAMRGAMRGGDGRLVAGWAGGRTSWWAGARRVGGEWPGWVGGLKNTTFESKHNFRPQARGSRPLFFPTTLHPNATFDHEHGGADRDFCTPLAIKTLLLTTSTELQTVTFFIPISIKTLHLTTRKGLQTTVTFSYPSQSKRCFQPRARGSRP